MCKLSNFSYELTKFESSHSGFLKTPIIVTKRAVIDLDTYLTNNLIGFGL